MNPVLRADALKATSKAELQIISKLSLPLIEIMQTVNILGTEYTIEYGTEEDFPKLANCDGYFDKSTKRIVISVLDYLNDPMSIDDLQYYQNKVLRHECIHAMMWESGLGENANWDDNGYEQLTDWIAVQSPKLFKIFDELGILE